MRELCEHCSGTLEIYTSNHWIDCPYCDVPRQLNRERLENAIRVLRGVKLAKFYIGAWYLAFTPPTTKEPDLGTLGLMLVERVSQGNDCGFVACAVGHMALDPWFNTQGLSKRGNSVLLDGEDVNTTALGKFFGIPTYKADVLFMGSTYYLAPPHVSLIDVKPEHVIERVEKLLAEKETT